MKINKTFVCGSLESYNCNLRGQTCLIENSFLRPPLSLPPSHTPSFLPLLTPFSSFVYIVNSTWLSQTLILSIKVLYYINISNGISIDMLSSLNIMNPFSQYCLLNNLTVLIDLSPCRLPSCLKLEFRKFPHFIISSFNP